MPALINHAHKPLPGVIIVHAAPVVSPWPNPTDLTAIRAWLRANAPDPDAVRQWVHRTITARPAGRVPLLGSPAWQALPDTDPRKHAALVHAALAHLAEHTPAAVAARLRRELDEFATSVRRMFTEADNDLRRARVELGYSTGPTHAELVRRRNTYHCHACGTRYHGAIPCPQCGWAGTPDQIRGCVAAGCDQLAPGQHRPQRRAA
ncbi:MAG: DUF2742 domain-containing protein [Labedaea sp.]